MGPGGKAIATDGPSALWSPRSLGSQTDPAISAIVKWSPASRGPAVTKEQLEARAPANQRQRTPRADGTGIVTEGGERKQEELKTAKEVWRASGTPSPRSFGLPSATGERALSLRVPEDTRGQEDGAVTGRLHRPRG